MRKTIAPGKVRMGMKVLGFEGSWLHHPFWKKNFRIDDPETLRKVQESDVSGVVIEIGIEDIAVPVTAPRQAPAPASARPPRRTEAFVPVARSEAPINQDLERAKAVMQRARRIMFRVFEEGRLGRAVRGSDVSGLVEEISDAVMRNPAAMLHVARMKSKTEYTYMHSVAVCTLMINFARTLDLPEDSHRAIGMAGLLHDLGKVTMPIEILNKTGPLTDAEFEQMKMHTLNGRDLIAESTDIPEIALDVCAHHHEKMDGTGYPFGRQGAQLSVHARMSAICDVYDALTSDRIYKPSWTPQQALGAMQAWHGHFDDRLYFQFLRSVGIFPPGMLVELRSQRLAMILPGGRRNSRPRARAFYDLRQRDFIEPVDVQLDDSLRHDQVLREASPLAHGLPDWDLLKAALLGGRDPRPMVDKAA
ncbi:HD-GYP domain-containing protein [Sphingobium lignivorans]|uniref:HD-GYP domain-containing protein (C-di-GMP phosphodiesterase class II) n=1 Tax=Sphingobium lignivorans TaxID=2735886 RepID=A0ABR6NGY3_9SPHN|nr:HD-GYP domain-containing protein [Sphingobium lignivorans]MBB5986346.1 HD-GYP domain-containing protein (c-di-GMP phosphodiesterase class II) [Sphingobium lignivorans]